MAFDWFSQRRRPNADESLFRETSRVIQASVWFSIPGVGLALTFLWAVSRGTVPSIGKIIGGDGRYLEENDWKLLAAVGVYLLGSVGAAYLFDWRLRRRDGATLTSTHSQWRQTFYLDRPDGAQTYVRVSTSSGQQWGGLVGHYSADLEVDGRELVLRSPISRAALDAEDFTPVEGLGALILRGDVINSIQVFYPSSEP